MWNFLPYSPRKSVPWRGIDLLLILFIYVFLQILVGLAVLPHFDANTLTAVPETSIAENEEIAQAHQIARMIILGQNYPFVFWLAFFAGVIVIPISEEFLFRLIFQGFLEKTEKHLHKNLFLALPRGAIAIISLSAFFALLHVRSTENDVTNLDKVGDLNMLVSQMFVYLVFHMIFVASVSLYLIFARNATLDDLGIRMSKITDDITIGFAAAVLIIPPIIAFISVLNTIDPKIVWDPIPIFFLSLGLGFLYFRTHRIIPGIIVHCLLNGISFFYVCAKVMG